MKSQLFLLLIAICVSACSTRTLTLPDGRVLYKSTRFGAKEVIKRVEYRSPTGEVFIVDGYATDQVEAFGIITEAAVRGAISGVKP